MLPPRHELAAQAKATWAAWKETTRYELALTLLKMKMAYDASIREISEETSIPRSTVHKLIAWHYAGYPDCGPFSKPPVEHQPEEGRRQPGHGQRPPTRDQRQIVSLTLQLRDMTEHVAELEAGREPREPEPVALNVDSEDEEAEDRTVEAAVRAVLLVATTKRELLKVIDRLDDVVHAMPPGDEVDDEQEAGEEQAGNDEIAGKEEAGNDEIAGEEQAGVNDEADEVEEDREPDVVEVISDVDPDDPGTERRALNDKMFSSGDDGSIPDFLKR